MNYYTYAYLREDKTPYYIGKGKGDRIYSTNRKGLKPPKDKSRIIYLKQNLTEEEAFKHEIYMIAVLGRKDLGTGILHNKTDGGEGASGRVPSEEFRKKLSDRQKGEKNHNYGKTASEETKRKISEARKGKTHSEESKIKMSEAHKGKIISEESKKRMSVANKGKILSKETRRKMSEARKNISEETRRKISETSKGRIHSEETKRKISEASKNRSEEIRKKQSVSMSGRKWWNDGCGNRKRMIECPGDGWKLGRK